MTCDEQNRYERRRDGRVERRRADGDGHYNTIFGSLGASTFVRHLRRHDSLSARSNWRAGRDTVSHSSAAHQSRAAEVGSGRHPPPEVSQCVSPRASPSAPYIEVPARAARPDQRHLRPATVRRGSNSQNAAGRPEASAPFGSGDTSGKHRTRRTFSRGVQASTCHSHSSLEKCTIFGRDES